MKTMSSVSSTLLTALAGALFVGLASAVLFALAIAPAGGIPFGIAQVGMMFVLGAVFGTIAGGVAGASETQAAPVSVPEPARVHAATVRA